MCTVEWRRANTGLRGTSVCKLICKIPFSLAWILLESDLSSFIFCSLSSLAAGERGGREGRERGEGERGGREGRERGEGEREGIREGKKEGEREGRRLRLEYFPGPDSIRLTLVLERGQDDLIIVSNLLNVASNSTDSLTEIVGLCVCVCKSYN